MKTIFSDSLYLKVFVAEFSKAQSLLFIEQIKCRLGFARGAMIEPDPSRYPVPCKSGSPRIPLCGTKLSEDTMTGIIGEGNIFLGAITELENI